MKTWDLLGELWTTKKETDRQTDGKSKFGKEHKSFGKVSLQHKEISESIKREKSEIPLVYVFAYECVFIFL